jgi:hypothetical protein
LALPEVALPDWFFADFFRQHAIDLAIARDYDDLALRYQDAVPLSFARSPTCSIVLLSF